MTDVKNSWNIMNESTLSEKFPLHRACRDGDVTLLNNFLKDKDVANKLIYLEDTYYGWTPAHWAAYFGKLECLRLLVMSAASLQGSKPQLPDLKTSRFQQTPAHIAAFASHPHCLLWLLQAGAHQDSKDYLGDSPLHKAARSGSTECVSLLIQNSANIMLKNNNGQFARNLAHDCGYVELAKHLANFSHEQELKKVCALPNPSNGYYGFRAPVTNGSTVTNGKRQHEPEESMEMETDDSIPNGHLNGAFNGITTNGAVINGHNSSNNLIGADQKAFQPPFNGSQPQNGCLTAERDITLSKEISQNLAPVAGRKRSREESLYFSQPKKMRTDDASSPLSLKMAQNLPPMQVHPSPPPQMREIPHSICPLPISLKEPSPFANDYNDYRLHLMMTEMHGC